jgi:UDP-glucose 4-epimerase
VGRPLLHPEPLTRSRVQRIRNECRKRERAAFGTARCHPLDVTLAAEKEEQVPVSQGLGGGQLRAVVTGVAGFMGSHVAEVLKRDGASVLGLDDLSGGFLNNVPDGVRFERRSILEPLDELLQSFKPDVVYHLAAYAAEGLSHHIPVFNSRNNFEGTVNVLGAAYRAGTKHFVFTSSIAVYGHGGNAGSFSEEDRCDPCDPYGVAKLACELHIRTFFTYYGRPSYTIFRPHNVYGPRQNVSDPYRNVVGIFTRCALKEEPLPIFGDGRQTRSFSFIDGVAAAIAMAPRVPKAANETFNIGADHPTSVLRLAEMVAKAVGVPLRLKHLPPRREVLHAHSTHRKAAQVFSEHLPAEVALQEGLLRMVDHVRRQPAASPTPCPSPIEIEDRLPPSWASHLPAAQR